MPVKLNPWEADVPFGFSQTFSNYLYMNKVDKYIRCLMKNKILPIICAVIIISVVGGATLEKIIEKADEPIIITGPIENTGENLTGTNFEVFNNSSYQPFLENITIPNLPPIQFPQLYHESSIMGGYSGNSKNMMACYDASFRTSGTIGFSVGGAKDINNFRENIFWGYLPQISDITYEGLFYDYFFNTGEQTPCDELFCPSYSYAISINPLTGEKEYYLTVGLNSGILQSEFHRKQLNLVIVLDVSGSMGSAFNRYYYNGEEYVDPEGPEPDWNKTKMEVAKESIVALLDHLNEGDRLGIVLFDGSAQVMEELTFIKDKNMARLEDRILEIVDRGSTNMDAGMQAATTLLQPFKDFDSSEYENRIIFLTDAQPNTGDISEDGLLGQVAQNSKNHIYTTFIGIGVDFNSLLIEKISKTRGANYYSVHSSTEFMQRMDDEFEYMVTPLVFNLQMKLISDGYEIMDVFGSPDANESTGELMNVSTLFPSARVNNETKGGLIVLQLKKLTSNATMSLEVSYEDRNGQIFNNNGEVTIEEHEPDYFQNCGIRKGILLVRYVTLMKKWIAYQTNQTQSPYISQWERKSLTLRVSEEFKQIFTDFAEYFTLEMEALDDETLQQELDILQHLGSLDVPEIKVTSSNNHLTINVESGSLINLSLIEEDEYSWKIKDHNDDIIYLTESFSWNDTKINETMKTWIFRADNQGNTTLILEYTPSVLDSECGYLPTFTLNIEVE